MWFLKMQASDVQHLILILQSDQAFWLKISEGKIVDQFNETIVEDPAQLLSRCPWVHNDNDEEPIDVTLLLDTTMDEVDRVSVAQTDNVVINKYRQLTTTARLRADYPLAHAYALPSGYNNQIAALMHPDIPEQWSAWLLFMQSKNVVFSKVATASELVANWSGEQFVGPTLLVMQVAGFQRHLLVDRGRILFLRTAHMGSATGVGNDSLFSLSKAAVAQSIGHLRSAIPEKYKQIRVISELRVSGRDGGEGVAGDSVVSYSSNQHSDQISLGNSHQDSYIPESVDLLVAFAAEWTIEFSESSLCDQDNSGISPLIEHSVEKSSVLVYRSRWLRKLGILGVNKFTFLRRSQRLWYLSRPGVGKMYAFLPSLKYEKVCRRIRVMFRLSVFIASMAVVGAAAALANGITGARHMDQQEQQRASIELAVSNAYDDALVSHSHPRMAAETLIIADLLTRATTATAQTILSSVATAVNAVPGVSVDRMVWAVVKVDDSYESLTHALAAVPSIRSVELRSGAWAVQVEIAGRVSGDNLITQKILLDTLLVELRALRGAMDVVVLESPVDLALSSSTDSRRADQYRLTMMLGEQ